MSKRRFFSEGVFTFYWTTLKSEGTPDPMAEYKFCNTRRWRFDFAWPEHKVALEIDGNAWRVAGGGRHSSPSDMEKMSAAAALGWRVFRLSPSMLREDPSYWVGIIEKALSGSVSEDDFVAESV